LAPRRDSVAIRLSDGCTLAAPPSLASISTYVLLEQESWFEIERAVVLRYLAPGMTAIDVGANIGVYSVPMARRVSPGGIVVAYEPGSEAGALQHISRALNGADNLEIVAAALSDGERRGRLAAGASSELNTLGASGAGEDIRVTSLDHEAAARAWPAVDFLKIDAEGEEARIVAGGRGFFAKYSPLVLFEVRQDADFNHALQALFTGIGYRCYRALLGEPVLIANDAQRPFDLYELNLFAAKPDRARRLAEAGLLVDPLPPWTPAADGYAAALSHLRAAPFAAPFAGMMNIDAQPDPDYRDGFTAFSAWHDRAQPLAARCAALAFAFARLRALCERAPTMARLSTFARAAWDWGYRNECFEALRKVIRLGEQGQGPAEPFWPPCPRYDGIAVPRGQGRNWFMSAAVEQFERAASHSSLFHEASSNLAWLAGQGFASAEMERRRVLQSLRAGTPVDIPPVLRTPAPDNLNTEIWTDPGTIAVLAGRGDD